MHINNGKTLFRRNIILSVKKMKNADFKELTFFVKVFRNMIMKKEHTKKRTLEISPK